MKAVILAAGKGKRMRELTQEVPKPMIEVRGAPILEHIITGLRDEGGVKDFFIITGYHSEVVEAYFKSGEAWDVSISYGKQVRQDGTGKAPEVAKAWVGDERFILSYGDILVERENYRGIVSAFQDDALISLWEADDVSKLGAVILDEENYLQQLVEKPEPGTVNTRWVNAGIYGFTPEIFDYTSRLALSPRGEYELTDAIQGLVDTGKKVRGYSLEGEWYDVRDPEILAEINQGE